jgi:PIN domain nuclease of toxin-antitoxin system
MIYLIDTHLLIWMSMKSSRLTESTKALLEDIDNEIFFSAISISEIAVKQQLAKSDFNIDASAVRRAMVEEGYRELPVNGLHAAFVATLPPIHKDPFDRLLVAQANIEGMTLITADDAISRYPGPILKI